MKTRIAFANHTCTSLGNDKAGRTDPTGVAIGGQIVLSPCQDGRDRCQSRDQTNPSKAAQGTSGRGDYHCLIFFSIKDKTPSDYIPKAMDFSSVTMNREMHELSEALAKNAHEIWAKQLKARLALTGDRSARPSMSIRLRLRSRRWTSLPASSLRSLDRKREAEGSEILSGPRQISEHFRLPYREVRSSR